MEENNYPQFIEKINPIINTWEIVRQEKKGQLVEHRTKIIKGYMIASVVTTIVTMGFGLLNFSIFGSILYVAALTGGLLLFLTIFAIITGVLAAQKREKEYITQFTNNLLPSIASIYFENLVCDTYSPLNTKEIQALNFFGKSNNELIIKNTLKGSVKNNPIAIYKIGKDRKNEHRIIHEKHTTFISIDVPLELKVPVVLNPSLYNPYIGKTLNKLWNKTNTFIQGLPNVQEYDYFIDFSKHFTVHTSDRALGAILLQDPSYLELMELAQGTLFPLRIVFMKNKICVWIEDNIKTLFPTPNLNVDTNEQDFIKSLYVRLDFFSNIIHTLIAVAANAIELNNKENTNPN